MANSINNPGSGGVSQETLDAAVAPLASQVALDTAISNAVPTGTYSYMMKATEPTGWIFATGTIGSASSGADYAAADAADLYAFFWDNLADAQAAVAGGRGASAAADFAANKTLTQPDVRGRGLVAKDDLGGSAASRMTSGGSGVDGATLGAAGGSQTHQLTAAQMAAHNHLPGTYTSQYFRGAAGTLTVGAVAGSFDQETPPSTIGSDAAHNNTQPSIITNVFVKL